jgi:hypothetical protein
VTLNNKLVKISNLMKLIKIIFHKINPILYIKIIVKSLHDTLIINIIEMKYIDINLLIQDLIIIKIIVQMNNNLKN